MKYLPENEALPAVPAHRWDGQHLPPGFLLGPRAPALSGNTVKHTMCFTAPSAQWGPHREKSLGARTKYTWRVINRIPEFYRRFMNKADFVFWSVRKSVPVWLSTFGYKEEKHPVVPLLWISYPACLSMWSVCSASLILHIHPLTCSTLCMTCTHAVPYLVHQLKISMFPPKN